MKRYLLGLLLMPSIAHAEMSVIRSGTSVKLTEDGTAFLPPGVKAFDLSPVSEKSIIYVQGGRWPSPSAVDVCWVNPEAGGEIVADLENWLAAEYRKAGIGFRFQGKCVDMVGKNEIRAYLRPKHTWKEGMTSVSAGGGLSYLGPVDAPLNDGDGPGTMSIHISKDVIGYGKSGFRDWFIETTRATATHEFGHALGLAHEQERNDAPICQDQKGSLPSAGAYLFVGQYDSNSIMNYCKTGTGVASLSAGDITGLKTLYPGASTVTTTTSTPPPSAQPKGSYTIRSRARNLCIQGNPKMSGNGTLLEAAACDQTDSQSFFAEHLEGGFWQIKSTRSGLCMDIPGASKINGAKVQLHECNKTFAQQFRFADVDGGWLHVINRNSDKCIYVQANTPNVQQLGCGISTLTFLGFFLNNAAQSSTAAQIQSLK